MFTSPSEPARELRRFEELEQREAVALSCEMRGKPAAPLSPAEVDEMIALAKRHGVHGTSLELIADVRSWVKRKWVDDTSIARIPRPAVDGEQCAQFTDVAR